MICYKFIYKYFILQGLNFNSSLVYSLNKHRTLSQSFQLLYGHTRLLHIYTFLHITTFISTIIYSYPSYLERRQANKKSYYVIYRIRLIIHVFIIRMSKVTASVIVQDFIEITHKGIPFKEVQMKSM